MIVDRDSFTPIRSEDWDLLRFRYRSWRRVDLAIRLALDLDTCIALLGGEPVDPVNLDPRELSRASQTRLVRLDLRAIDLLEVRDG